MSRQAVVKRLLNREFFCLTSELLGEEVPRTIFYSIEVGEVVDGASSTGIDATRFAKAKAVMDDFIEFGHITVGMDPFDKDSNAIMARVDPTDYEIFDLRAISPQPGIRILGCFMGPDEFIMLTWDFRENFEDHWPEQVERCRAEWERLFPGLEPHKGAHLNDYITQNASAV